jgi:hypothetical protein
MPESSRCPNCGEERSGQFCGHCGQKDQPLRQSTVFFLRQALNEYFGIDGRLWRTLRPLLFLPGRLTAEHLRGRRRRYLAPLRIYLTVSVLFFFLLSVLDPAATLERKIGGAIRDTTLTAGSRLADVEAQLDSLGLRIADLRTRVDDTETGHESPGLRFTTDSLLQSQPWATTESLRLELLRKKQLEFQQSILATYPPDSVIRPADLVDASELVYQGRIDGIEVSGFGDEGPQRGSLCRATTARTRTEMASALSDLARSMIERIPMVMFLMLPVFALLMKLVYIRRGWFYSEHLVFGLHNHAVAFVGFSIIAVLVAIAGNPRWVSLSAAGILLAMNGYFLVAQKHVYGQSWMKTLLKYVVIFVSYWSVILFFGLSILVVLGSFLD